MKNIKNTNGSVTIEATISLSAFMFTLVTILTIVNICIVQARVSYAINTTAKEISQYSYLYSLTGLNDSQKKLEEAGIEGAEGVTSLLSDVNTAYNEIENLGKTGNQSADDIEAILSAWDSKTGSVETILDAGSSLESTMADIASDPKKLMFGIAKLAASEGFDLVKSHLIAAPLAKTLCKKHLVNTKDGDVDEYLKYLGVVPTATGSYIDGLDFSQSTLFPGGSSEITVKVSYDVKLIALLPIDFSFHFNQTAITQGWLAGEQSFTSSQTYIDNKTIWTEATLSERTSLIRHMGISDLKDEGYAKTSGLTDVQVYNASTNEFVMISSMNPLWSAEGEETMTLDDLDDVVLIKNMEALCGKIKSTTDGLNEVTTKTKVDGTTIKTENDCSDAANRIVLVIPEDEGLKEKIEAIIAEANTNGVIIELVSNYGNGANETVEKSDDGGTGE